MVMAFEEGTMPLTCRDCGAQHLARWSRMPVRERQQLRCKTCKGVLFEGNTVKDFTDLTLAS